MLSKIHYIKSSLYQGLTVIGLTETKLNEDKGKYTLNNKKTYKTWWTGKEEKSKSGGVGIAVKRGLDIHVANVIKKLGRLISIDLYFKGSAKTRIINVYVNCNEKEKDEREQLIKELLVLIKEAEKKYRVYGSSSSVYKFRETWRCDSELKLFKRWRRRERIFGIVKSEYLLCISKCFL